MIGPEVPPDGTCAQCGKPRRLDQSAFYRPHAERDPFCSAACCRIYYGCPLPILDGRGKEIEEVAA